MKNQKGITLIALIITIIVMLILVGVSVTVALNGGLFETAQDAVDRTKEERDNELAMSTNDIINQYLQGEEKEGLAIIPQKATYTVGEEVTIGNEQFFVIADDTEKVTLLAKYNLKEDGTQDTAAGINPCIFSTADGFTAGQDLNNNAIVKADTTSAVYKAIKYGEKFGTEDVIGRLMTLQEIESLGADKNTHSTAFCNTNGNSFVNSVDGVRLGYWLGTAHGSDTVWSLMSDMEYVMDSYFGVGPMTNNGVRPVIEISKSAIQ